MKAALQKAPSRRWRRKGNRNRRRHPGSHKIHAGDDAAAAV